jgi:hypothetical protein
MIWLQSFGYFEKYNSDFSGNSYYYPIGASAFLIGPCRPDKRKTIGPLKIV